MDYQTTYNEAMAKLAEAQKCQNEIISGRSFRPINELIKDRNRKLNEALGKALDLADEETDKGRFDICSPSLQVMTAIYDYARSHNISCQYSIEVDAKFAKIFAKGINAFNQFLNQQRMLGNL